MTKYLGIDMKVISDLKKNNIIEIAEKSLAGLLSENSYEDLDLPCDISGFDIKKWDISYLENSKWSIEPVHALKAEFLRHGSVQVTYILYVNDFHEFVDEFFIIHDQNDD